MGLDSRELVMNWAYSCNVVSLMTAAFNPTIDDQKKSNLSLDTFWVFI